MLNFNLTRPQELEFKSIFERYKRQIYTQVYTIVKSQYAAEEITQEIFIKLWLSQDALQQVKNLDGYIYTIVRNYSLNYLRKIASNARLVNELQRVAVTGFNNTEQEMQVTECRQLISKAVNQLSPQRQLVYRLSKEDGLNYDEIAAQLNLSKHTVKNHLMAALSFINSYLTRNGVNPTLVVVFTLCNLF
ncbi:RNA polymerase sigma-70 factor [Mucilaginibacter sp. Bleaf8]|uniref:RNA polymerase sigma-70 factor n=1 Tax=Mucilaginibacter sp. Bleaf8 TaxID=2834430 RepID=UPI001BCD6F4B|nr:RNA polymerase sigma-70 factor [Mucilaginibacter sp. Bleaf8]MBS7562804.1 RNA polymerase sigma-70 factor [Mucilaginibacter sp. Bleaf8]